MDSRTTDTKGVLKTALASSLDGITANGKTIPYSEKVKANTTPPYLTNGPMSTRPRPYVPGGGYKGSQNHEVQIDGFSSYDGDKEIDAISASVVEVLMDTMTVGAGHQITDRELVNSRTIKEDNGEIRHAVIEVRIAIQIL